MKKEGCGWKNSPSLDIFLSFTINPSLALASSQKVKSAYVAIMNFAPLYVAIERGFMKEENIEVEMQKVASGADAMAFLAQGTLDVGGVGIGASTFNAFNKGFDLRIVSSAAIQPQKRRTHCDRSSQGSERFRKGQIHLRSQSNEGGDCRGRGNNRSLFCSQSP